MFFFFFTPQNLKGITLSFKDEQFGNSTFSPDKVPKQLSIEQTDDALILIFEYLVSEDEKTGNSLEIREVILEFTEHSNRLKKIRIPTNSIEKAIGILEKLRSDNSVKSLSSNFHLISTILTQKKEDLKQLIKLKQSAK